MTERNAMLESKLGTYLKAAPNICQICYITADIDKAVAAFAATNDTGPFHMLRHNMVPHAQGGFAETHVALAWIGNMQIEIIQPLGGRDEIYRDYLPKDGADMAFHHFCVRAATWEEFADRKAHFQALGCEIGFARESGPYRTFYADTRKMFGHFVEYVWLEDEGMLTMNGKIPAY